LQIQQMKDSLAKAKNYLEKLKFDRISLRRALFSSIDNLNYLKKHCGTIALDHVRVLTDKIKRTNIFLDQLNNDIVRFEKDIDKHHQDISDKESQLERMRYEQENKVVPFRAKK
jgi:DNA repair ATPase RecN